MKLKNSIYLVPFTVLFVAGCATGSYTSDIDSGKFVQVQPKDAPGTKVIREYIPVPIPGQLRPVPNSAAQKATSKPILTKEQAVADAKKNAEVYPDQNDFFNAMMTYDYMPGALYTIYAAPLNITDIVFPKGEKIISQAAGDTVRWQIATTYSGENKDMHWHILIKPQKSYIYNTMIITTNKRVYHLILKSVDQDQAMVSVKWNYPGKMVQGFSGADLGDMSVMSENKGLIPPPQKSSAMDLNLSNMRFNYEWRMLKGGTPLWYPQQIFSSGHQTYIKFPHEVVVSNATMPVPFVQTNDGEYGTSNFNWRMKGDYMVIDTVIKSAYLKAGTKKSGETVIEIRQKNK